MVLKEDLMCHPYPTENLILKERRRHHRTCIAPVYDSPAPFISRARSPNPLRERLQRLEQFRDLNRLGNRVNASESRSHWQLRALIGTSSQDNEVFYPVGLNSQQIQRYNLTTNESSTFKLLTFVPRCLVVKNGWMCCGGENGQYASMCLDEGNALSDADTEAELDPYGAYQPGFLAILNRHRAANKNILAKGKKFGADRINCVTMWFPPSPGRAFAGAYQEPVSLLANNDKTVTVVSVRKSERIDKIITYPDCVNRAVLSPDGQLLIAIGDDPYLYAHRRVEKESGSSASDTDALVPEQINGKSYVWKECSKVKLKGQRSEDRSEYRGSFAACFSNTGEILAVGSQYGMICIFSTKALLEGTKAMLTCFTSTAPKSSPGAIRDMSFCPGPFDLLAWTEDRATVCIADVRTNFTTRQILKLTDEDTYEHLTVNDRTTIDPRLLDARPDAIASNLANALDISHPERRITSRPSSAAWDWTNPSSNTPERYDYPLTADETQVLEALQEHRRRRERRDRDAARDTQTPDHTFLSGRPRVYAGTPTDPIGPRPARERAISAIRNRDTPPSARERSASVTRAVDDILGNIDAQRERIRDAQTRLRGHADEDRSRADQAQRLAAMQARMRDRLGDVSLRSGPPRRANRAPSGAEGYWYGRNINRDSAAYRAGMAEAEGAEREESAGVRVPGVTAQARAGERASGALPASFGARQGSSAWDTISSLYSLTLDSEGNITRTARDGDEEGEAAADGSADPLSLFNLVGQLQGQLQHSSLWDDDVAGGVRRRMGAGGTRQNHDRDETAGLAWSEDGTTLFVGAFDGVYEFHVNAFARRLFPSVTMR